MTHANSEKIKLTGGRRVAENKNFNHKGHKEIQGLSE